MHLIQTTRTQLIAPLQIVNSIIENRHAKPILANVLITKSANGIQFLASDEDIQIETMLSSEELAIEPSADATAITVPAKKMLDIIRALPDAPINIALNDQKVTIQCNRSKYQLQTLPAEGFPVMKDFGEPTVQITISQKELKELINHVQYAMAIRDVRHFLQGMLLAVRGTQIIGVATDGHRLAIDAISLPDAAVNSHEVIVPRKTVTELQRLLQDNETPIDISIYGRLIEFRFGNIHLVSNLVDGKFPDFERVIPKNHTNQLPIDRVQLQQSLNRASILTNEKSKAIRIKIDAPETLQINVFNLDQEEAEEELKIEYSGESLTIGFNVDYLLDVLSHIKNNELTLWFGDSTSSMLITVANQPHFKYIVMPMRI